MIDKYKKKYKNNYKKLSITLTAACLSALLSYSTMASAIKPGVLQPILFLLQNSDESDSLLPGKLYSASDLAFWRNRVATNGPHITRGDAYGTSETGSYPGYRLVELRAESFPNIPDRDITITGKDIQYINRLEVVDFVSDALTQITPDELSEIEYWGHCVVLGTGRHAKYDSFEFGRIENALSASFFDLVSGTSVYTERIKALLLAQAQRPCMDFSNRQIFRNGQNNTTFWLYLEWLHRVLKTYDYLDESAFTDAEKSIMENWFKGAADWSYQYLQERSIENAYSVRAVNPIDSKFDPDYWLHRDQYESTMVRYKNSSRFWPAGSLIGNRELGQLNFLVHAGVKFDNPVWKKEGALTVKEYIAFHFDDDGYFAELNRSTHANPAHGLGYGANSLLAITEIAHILYLDGYENLFEYRSKARVNPLARYSDLRNETDVAIIEEGPVERSLEWVFLKFRENFMLDSAPAIYPSDVPDGQENTETVIHFCTNTSLIGRSRFVGRMYQPSAIANRYYKNSTIKDIYNFNDDFGNICEFVETILDIRSGPHNILPATLFQYSDVNEDY